MKTYSKNLVRNFKSLNPQAFNLNLNAIVESKLNVQGQISSKNFRHLNHLTQVNATASQEKKTRYGKFIQKTDKIYKPSKTITFDRNGELLLFSCDNLRHSQIYLKYPYVMYDSLIPLALYNFFVDPCKFFIFNSHTIFL